MSSPWRDGLAAALAAAVLAGCASVPTSGPVVAHDSAGQQVDNSVNVVAEPPPPGASALLVVEGFLHAMGTDQPGFPVARQYLTTAANRIWHPDAGVSIYADGSQPKETEASTPDHPAITLDTVLTGTLTPTGEYREAGGGLPRNDFGLVRNADGEWRISKPPDGLLISRYHFSTNYEAYDLHFLETTGTALVPDPRYYARNAISLAGLVRAQLAGPGKWLAPAVRPQPAGDLTVDRVDFAGQGIADVQLSGRVADLDEAARRTLMAEVTTTLTELRQVAGAYLSVSGTQLSLPGSSSNTLLAADFAEFAPAAEKTPARLLGVRQNRVQVIDLATGTPSATPFAPALTDPGALAVRQDLGQAAAVNPDGTALSVAGANAEAATVILSGEQLLRPDYSRQGELWAIGDGDGATGFKVFGSADLQPVPVSVGQLPAGRIRAFQVSPDGARLALVMDGEDVEQAGIARIVRTADAIRIEDFRPVKVSPPAGADRRLLDLGWLSATDLLVLVSQSSYSNVVRVDQDSASATDVGPAEVTGLSELAVAPGQAVLRAPTALLRYDSAFNWKPTGITLTAAAFSG